jgi:hypothetical protein
MSASIDPRRSRRAAFLQLAAHVLRRSQNRDDAATTARELDRLAAGELLGTTPERAAAG